MGLFPSAKSRSVLLFLVLLASIISVSELLVTYFFTRVILEIDGVDESKINYLLVFFFICLALTRSGHYLQRIYRLKLFDKSLNNKNKSKSPIEDSWQWALALELSTILGIIVQLIAIAIFFTCLNISYGLINFFIVVIVLQWLSYLFSKQIEVQKSFSKAYKNNKSVSSSVKIMARIKSGEIGVLIAGASFLLSIGILVYFIFGQFISPVHSIVLFFGLKMQSSSLSMLSSSLMRFARARVNSE
jgi:hypothetical protein